LSRKHDERAARGLGVISSIAPRGKGFIFATDAQNTEVFIHCQSCRPSALFDELMPGDKISFSIAQTPKGMRGHDVRRMTESEEEAYRLQQRTHTELLAERRGNATEYGQRQTFVDESEDTQVRNRPRRR